MRIDAKPEKHWINRKNLLKYLNTTGQSFDAWKVQPVARIGREKFFVFEDVISFRIGRELNKLELKVEDKNGISPAIEKAGLDRAKRIWQELQNEKETGKLFPIVAAEYVFSRIGAEIVAVLAAIPSKIKRADQKVSAALLNEVNKEIAKAKNSCIDIPDRIDEFLDEYYR
ncbi:MAG: phage terminase Nu1 subunit (DNA packaging protein) [Candidatus Azotimanducaceae bacterium]|jgi:phage terminase Nu1 subunit (DNA packaging protein)